VHPPYAEHVQQANAQVLKLAEHAMSLSMAGDPSAAVKDLIEHGEQTLNGKLIESAYLVLNRYADSIADRQTLADQVQALRSRYVSQSTRPALGEQKRQAGGLTLRAGGGKAAGT
jgi:hypothetical protein